MKSRKVGFPMKKKFLAVILAAALFISLGVVAVYAVQSLNPDSSDKKALVAVNIGGTNKKTLVGKNGSRLLVDSISDEEYDEMMRLLYPNGIMDEQGLSISGVENLEEIRTKFIAEHTKAYAINGSEITEVKIVPFNIKLSNIMNGPYECLFYKATIGQDTFVFPSEWGNQSCGFLTASEAGVYLAYTDLGIWKVIPDSLETKKITADAYAGKTQSDLEKSIDYELFWIDSVHISPNGLNVLYRTNRDSSNSIETSVWAIDLQSGDERQVIKPANNNDIIGFISESQVVVGALADTRIANINTSALVSVSLPKLPNLYISSVDDNTIVYTSYKDTDSKTTAFINHVDATTGELTLITKVSGFLAGESFSPSGNIYALGYGSDPMKGIEDVMLIDLTDGSQKLLARSLKNAKQVGSWINNFIWAYDETLIISAQDKNESNAYLILSSE